MDQPGFFEVGERLARFSDLGDQFRHSTKQDRAYPTRPVSARNATSSIVKPYKLRHSAALAEWQSLMA